MEVCDKCQGTFKRITKDSIYITGGSVHKQKVIQPKPRSQVLKKIGEEHLVSTARACTSSSAT